MPRIRDYHLQLPYFHLHTSRSLNLLYGVRVLRDLVNKFAIFFLPIFLYQHGSQDPFWQFLPGNKLQKGVLLLVLFYIIHRLTIALSTIEIGKIITHIGYQKALVVGFALQALFLSLLYITANPGWLLLAAAFINGLESSFFWNSYFTLSSKFTLAMNVGRNLSLLNVFLQLAQAIAPALGGIIIVTFGFSSLFMVGLIGVLSAIILVLQLELKKESDQVSWGEFFRWAREKTFRRFALSNFGRYANDATLILWSLYVFLILGTVERVGFLYTISLFLALMISFAVGFYIDHKKNRRPFYVSGGLLSLLWLLRTQIISFWQIAIIDTVDKLAANFHWLFFDSMMIKRSKGHQALSYFVYRELLLSLLAVIFWLMVGGLFLFLTDAWLVLFILPAGGVLLSLLLKEHHRS